MSYRFEMMPRPVLSRHGLHFEWLPVSVKICDYCNTCRVDDLGTMCRECRSTFERIAERLAGVMGVSITPEQIRRLGFGLQPSQFVYGKPWQHHLPPHERAHYGLHT